ncbi:DUF975 family protein [Psychromonas antarctica]|jgi:uncharacterized membrane protein|uniref:DUF975 family protein n=1 Tax=Psychromonas antarctica TaxID=67573 RepID=UPI001EE8FD61|nr:DUF975 family protein [Psychromonas antarctica]MCG6201076.1 DUF975 family protein [Psychromonas antarctica]
MTILSTTLNQEITAQARQALNGKWGLVVGAMLIVILLNILSQIVPIVGPIVWLIVSGAFSLGFASLYLNLCRGEKAEFSQIFSGFNNFTTALVANLLMTLFILLWALLLIIPGIIAAYSYMLTFFILSDEPSLTASEAINKSKEMMKGYKWKAFFLSCRFIGWALLAILTLGIALLWLAPYIGMSFAKFYEDIKENHAETVTIAEEPQALAC